MAIEKLPTRFAMALVIMLETVLRTAYRGYLRTQVDDPWARRALVPKHGVIANMPTFGRGFLRSFSRRNTDLITTPIERFVHGGIRTVDGVEHEYDMIVLATGFKPASDPESFAVDTVLGRDGFDQGRFYRENGMQAYAGVTLPKMPNRWFMYGAYGWNGVTWVSMMEKAGLHIARVIDEARRRGADVVEVTQPAHSRWHRAMKDSRFTAVAETYLVDRQRGKFNVHSYFSNPRGEAPILRPSYGFRNSLWDHSDTFNPAADYSFRDARPSAPDLSRSDAADDLEPAGAAE